MILKSIAVALVSTALMTGATFAQTAAKDRSDANVAVHRDGEWRSSKLIGVDVYNEANEKIGAVEDLIVDKSGRVENVILGVGGFLGMGEHYVAVPMDKLKWVNQAVRTSSSAATDKTTTGAASDTNNSNRPARSANEKWYPDHAVYNATKDQLKAMPQFKYN
jgi:sporulation protein YlmC with PRC-barrel domain